MKPQPTNFVINARKFDGLINRSWSARLIQEDEFLLTFLGIFELEVTHPSLGVIRPGTLSYEYYWKNRWYNVFRFHEPDGTFRNYYCNINQPPLVSDGQLDYIDLDIDIVVWADSSFEILDLDEFNENTKIYGYSREMVAAVQESLSDVIGLIENKEFPFDYDLSDNHVNPSNV